MDSTTIATMGSVFMGFLCFGGSFASYMYHKPAKLPWGLFAIAVVLITVIPVTLAVFSASTP